MAKNELNQYYIECLRQDLVKSVGRTITTFSDFDYLSLKLKEKIKDSPSISTLKRLWGYVPNSSSYSRSTLNSLSRFLGFNDWNHYIENLMRASRVESGFLNANSIVSANLKKGDYVEITWNPNRRIMAEYTGGNRFAVVESENAKLSVGSMFDSLIITKGHPLLCTNVEIGDETYSDYIAGNKTGITSLRLVPKG